MALSKVILFSSLIPLALVVSKNHNEIVENLLSLDEPTDVALFTDKHDISDIVDVKRLQALVKIFDISDLASKLEPMKCPVKDDLEDHFMPSSFFSTPYGYRQNTVIIYVEDLGKLFAVFDSTVTNCTYVYDAGIYHQDSRFLFLIDSDDNVAEKTERILTSSPHITRHRHIAIAKRFVRDETKYLIFGLNLGLHRSSEKGKFLYVWDEKSKPTSLEEGFYANVTRNYNGHKFMYSGFNVNIPPLWCQKALKSFEEVQPGDDTFEGNECMGNEVSKLAFLSEMLNITWGVIAPADRPGDDTYQLDNTTGGWNKYTQMNYLIYGKADVTLFLPVYSPGNRVLGGTGFTYQTSGYYIYSAAPKRLPNALAIIYPFEPILWPAVLLTSLAMSIAFYTVPTLQRKVDSAKGLDPNAEKGVSIWFGIFALIGENMRNESVEYHRGAIRFLIGMWLLTGLLISSSFSGNLKGFLTNPGYYPKIDTLQKVLDSGKPFYWIDYEESNYVQSKTHRNPVVQRVLTERRNTGIPTPAFEHMMKMMDRTLKGEIIYIEMKGIIGLVYEAIFLSPTGQGGVVNAPIEEFQLTGIYNGLLRTSLLTPNFNRMIDRITSTGLYRHFYEYNNDIMVAYIRGLVAYKVDMEPPPAIAPLTLFDVQGLFYVWLLMIGISILAFFGEVLRLGRVRNTVGRIFYKKKTDSKGIGRGKYAC